MAVDTADLNPDFLKAITALQDYANAQGIPTHIISAYRTAEDQRQLYANYLAGQRGEPLPYPERGAVPLAAPPGSSPHERGIAADIEANDPARQAELRGFGPRFGLSTIGASDPTHFQMANAASSNPAASSASAAANPVSGHDNPLLTALIHYESGGRNITNTTQSTSSGPARGFLQITDGTWNEFGGNKFSATAQDAPFATQLAIGSNIPLSRWDPKTLNYLRSQGINFDPSKTLGENIAMTGGGGWSGKDTGGAPVSYAGLRATPGMGMSGFLMAQQMNSPGGWAGLMGQALAQGMSGAGGTPQIEDPQDQPAIRTPALSTQLTEGSPSAAPPSSGLGMTLASLTDTGLQPLDTGGINVGAPAMGSFSPETVGNALPMTGVGSLNPLSMYPATRYSRLS